MNYSFECSCCEEIMFSSAEWLAHIQSQNTKQGFNTIHCMGCKTAICTINTANKTVDLTGFINHVLYICPKRGLCNRLYHKVILEPCVPLS
ncbi:oxidoreductase-like protein [Bufonid herpesvirus 1]|uniref:oxidoreductase-like protein n=1 Tax=Bufonid herpesvirus 1 TaxID=2282206 RepID=UPI000EB692E7|nr:oxidoreductase-like protein [Bufonid herpesvirus 1]AXF48539.1 oxidoreductase-like protein [Bufonid herpesvirus 1]